jgi:fimbrial chaperone protein
MNKALFILRSVLPAFAVASLLILCASSAHAIKLTMKRVVFEGSKRTEVLTLINDSDEEQTYRLSWRNMAMKDGASLSPVEEGDVIPGLNIADTMVIFAPRRITIPAGASQQVRLMLRKPADLADGEYRSHLWIRPEEEAVKFVAPDAQPQGDDEQATGIQIKMLAGANFPVIVRQGKTNAVATITNPKLTQQDDAFFVSLDVNREGNRSLYGDFRFTCLSGSSPQMIHEIHGIAVYTETATRHLEFKFNVPAEGAGICQSMRVSYLSGDTMIAEATITAP